MTVYAWHYRDIGPRVCAHAPVITLYIVVIITDHYSVGWSILKHSSPDQTKICYIYQICYNRMLAQSFMILYLATLPKRYNNYVKMGILEMCQKSTTHKIWVLNVEAFTMKKMQLLPIFHLPFCLEFIFCYSKIDSRPEFTDHTCGNNFPTA